jgi:hypothetical protein
MTAAKHHLDTAAATSTSVIMSLQVANYCSDCPDSAGNSNTCDHYYLLSAFVLVCIADSVPLQAFLARVQSVLKSYSSFMVNDIVADCADIAVLSAAAITSVIAVGTAQLKTVQQCSNNPES